MNVLYKKNGVILPKKYKQTHYANLAMSDGKYVDLISCSLIRTLIKIRINETYI